MVRGWKHFRHIFTVEPFGKDGNTDWRSTSIAPLPDWIGISRLLQTDDVLNYHSALMITFNNKHLSAGSESAHLKSGPARSAAMQRPGIDLDEDDKVAEALVYTPHGIHGGDLNLIPEASPSIRTLAFLHGLHNVRVGTVSGRTALQSNLGAHNGLKAQRILNAKYWIGTHDEVKKGGGLVSYFLQREEISLKDAIEEEKRMRESDSGLDADSALVDAFEGTNWLDLRNGESRVLL